MKPILYPVQLVTGGGRAKGFTVAEYLPWSTLPTLRHTDVWKSLLYLYNRLGAAYDNFYEVLGFLSPNMKKLLQELQETYADSYRTSLFPDYTQVYASTESLPDIADPYHTDDYPQAYARLLMNSIPRGVWSG